MATWPLRPSTIRTTDELPVAAVMKSISATLPSLRLEYRLQDHRAGPVLPADTHRRLGGGDAPAPVVRRADQRGKAGRAVEARPAQPVDRAVAADQRGTVAVADHRVILDPRRVARGGGGRRIARVVLGLFGRAGAGRTGHQVARPQTRPCAVVQSAAKASGRNRIGISSNDHADILASHCCRNM